MLNAVRVRWNTGFLTTNSTANRRALFATQFLPGVLVLVQELLDPSQFLDTPMTDVVTLGYRAFLTTAGLGCCRHDYSIAYQGRRIRTFDFLLPKQAL
jgi:hypothetical protein